MLKPDLPLVDVATRAQWRQWLSANAARSVGVWAVTTKKDHVAEGAEFVSARDLNEECLCFGWVDSRPAKIDDGRSALLCTPRKARSGWSKVNKDRLVLLLERGLVEPAGLAMIEAAKADGSWSMLDDVDALIVPDDLRSELERYPSAAANFAAFPPSARRGILEWIVQAKRDETRASRIAEAAELAERNIRALQWPRTK